ncbi:MAG TPA: response regulator [Candidatus Binataceae bacterium]|nr:response regulator [Candidatus Binataceae bacterium]
MSQTILVIDDDRDLADTCARVLKAAGFACLVAYDSPMALSLFDSSRPALVLSDINLPTSDGYEIARYVKQKASGTPVILMTTYHHGNAPQQAAKAGAAGFLRKPFANVELIATVKLLLDHGKTQDPAD